MVFLLSNVLWHKGLRKYFKCYNQEKFYNAELLCEEAAVIFTLCIKKKGKLKNKK
jgi:hypothetical protein